MIKNFLFILNRFKTSSTLNIIGLSVAFPVFAITMIQTYYDFSYNRNFKHADDIYLFANYWKEMDNTMPSISIPLAHKMTGQFPEIQAACIVNRGNQREFQLPDIPESSFTLPLFKADEGLLTVFSPKILMGDAEKAFTERNNVMLTSDVARTLFGKENPVGKILRQDTLTYTVVAICEQFPDNCSVKNGIYTTILGAEDYEKMSWMNYSGFFRIHSEDVPALQEKLNQPDFLEITSIDRAELIPLTAVHFSKIEYIPGGGNLSATLSLLAIGILILLVAFINLMNFSVAMIPSRVRGVNIQKIMGAGAGQLRARIASEAPCFTFVSFLIALFLIALFESSGLKEFFTADLSLVKNAGLLAVLAMITMALSILFGIYPARRVTSFHPAMALSGSFAQSKGSVSLRNILITLQFFAAITLICIAIFIQMQHRYMINYSWGFQKENIVYLPVYSAGFVKVYKNEIKQNPAVLDCTISPELPGAVGQSWGMEVDGKYVAFTAWVVQSNFLDFFDIPVIEGRNFIPDDDGKSRIICNRAFLEKYEYAHAVGLNKKKEDGEFIGVMQDIHFEALHNGVRPLCLVTQNVDYHYRWKNYFFIKIAGDNTKQTVESLKKTWEKLSDNPFDLHFLDDSMDRLYQKENDLAKIISIFGLITVIIAVMGVYGLIVFNARYKAKEIAVRKVNGSTIREIILMLNRTVLLQLAIAFLIAVPAAWFVVDKWLESFAYKITIHWWVFLLGGLIVLLITLLTVSAQSYRAAMQNPTKALNSE